MIELKYVLVFLKYKDEILLLNRNKPSWMGCWNGVGGKIEKGETPYDAAIRETYEETGIKVEINNPYFKVGWVVNDDRSSLGGMYVFICEMDKKISTPTRSVEGILDYKTISWIMDPRNSGIAKNIPQFLPTFLNNEHVDFITIYNHEFDDLEIVRKVDLNNLSDKDIRL